jgi:preprotein translocase subunit Sec63
MDRYREITKARRLLGLPQRATIEQIKSNYRTLLAKWHPDKCRQNKEQCAEMTKKILSAYETIITYCSEYKYSFSKDEIRNHLSPEEWWLERFGDATLWGDQTKHK